MNKILHLTLLLALILALVLIFKWKTVQEEATRVGPARKTPMATIIVPPKDVAPKKPAVVATQNGYRFQFPTPLDHRYAPPLIVWGHQEITQPLEDGNIKTPPAPDWPPRQKQIPPAPTTVVIRWIFALP